jgi:hypothetical protein
MDKPQVNVFNVPQELRTMLPTLKFPHSFHEKKYIPLYTNPNLPVPYVYKYSGFGRVKESHFPRRISLDFHSPHNF